MGIIQTRQTMGTEFHVTDFLEYQINNNNNNNNNNNLINSMA